MPCFTFHFLPLSVLTFLYIFFGIHLWQMSLSPLVYSNQCFSLTVRWSVLCLRYCVLLVSTCVSCVFARLFIFYHFVCCLTFDCFCFLDFSLPVFDVWICVCVCVCVWTASMLFAVPPTCLCFCIKVHTTLINMTLKYPITRSFINKIKSSQLWWNCKCLHFNVFVFKFKDFCKGCLEGFSHHTWSQG